MQFIDLSDYFRRDSLLLHVGLLIRFRVFIFIVGRLFIQLSTVNFQHCSGLIALEDLLEVVLFNERVISVGLNRFSEVALLTQHLYEPL